MFLVLKKELDEFCDNYFANDTKWKISAEWRYDLNNWITRTSSYKAQYIRFCRIIISIKFSLSRKLSGYEFQPSQSNEDAFPCGTLLIEK
jgi:hypothetical protein